jgi:1-acyl-sn-glycerol-3-phosphate acyltransferase
LVLPNASLPPTLPEFAASAACLLKQGLHTAVSADNTLTGRALGDRNPELIESLLPVLAGIYHYYFRVKTDGWEHVPAGKALLIGSHNGGMAAPDTLMMTYDWFCRFGAARPIYALMEPKMWQVFPAVARLAAQMGALQANPQMALAALQQDASLLIYPGGVRDVFRPYSQRDRICFGGQRGFIKLALRQAVPVVPLISRGAHATLVVLADLYPQLQRLHQRGMPWLLGIDPGVFPIYLGLPWGIGIGPLPNLPLPVPLHTRVCPPIYFERSGEAAARDRAYVDSCYQQVVTLMQAELDRLFAEAP